MPSTRRRRPASNAKWRSWRAAANAARSVAASPLRRATRSPSSRRRRDEIEVGSKVVLEWQQTPGVVQSLKGDKVQVAFGQLLTTVDRKRLRVVSNSEYREATRPVTARTVVSVDVAARKLNFNDHIDVRGMRASEAVEPCRASSTMR